MERTFLSAHPFRPVDPDSVRISHRRLPHWEQPNRIYFVTFRLADSIAREKREQWQEEMLRLKRDTDRTRYYVKKQQAWLDKGFGRCILQDSGCAEAVEKTLLSFDRERYLLGNYVIMPNHVHLIVFPLGENTLSKIVKSWKGCSARAINRIRGASGTLWMDESFDHIIRNEAHFQKFHGYIQKNPEMANLSDGRFLLGCGSLSLDGQTGVSASHRASFSSVEQTLLSAQSTIVGLLAEPRRIHMLGIGGIGMAGLAFLLKERGHIVSGSDAQENRQTEWLRSKGISVQNEVPPDTEWVIRTRAVPDSHPDVLAATVPVSWRGDVLPELMKDRFTIAVSGTHGKTTTTSMIAQILDCGYCIGGEVEGFDGVARDGEIMVVEADESDGTVANYHPDIAVITNIEYDHMEHHNSFESFENCFCQFIAQTKEKIVYCADDPVAARLCENNPKAVPYSFEPLNVSLPGRHNQLNASAALTACRSLGQRCPDAVSFQGLENLKPVKRRFEMVFDGDYKVISDYAHHPTEIRALIQAALETLKPQRLLGVFQPHRYTRTRALGPDFPPAFQGLEKLWLLPVYAASEQPLPGGTTEDLMEHFSKDWKKRIKFFLTLEKTWQNIAGELKKGDVLLIIGAGDIEQMAGWARR